MKRLFSCVCTFVAAFILMSMTGVVTASASTGSIDTSHAKDGFVTVNYASDSKLKVGIQYGDNKTSYKNCPSGKTAEFSLDQGDGTYTITVCENISGTTYQVVSRETVNAKIKNEYAPYLISTADVQFAAGDAVSQKAAEICKGAATDAEKVTAIYNYIAGHYTYDTKLADEITSGKVSKYIPDTSATLSSSKGICYDLSSLFAAMCRSQSIPCSLTKGYAGRSYHAWNKVNVDGAWYQIDLTYAVTERVLNANSLSDCVSPLHYAQQSDSLAIAA
ncbi:transglutaminase-like domain-containing protein [Anaerotignum faecicola]